MEIYHDGKNVETTDRPKRLQDVVAAIFPYVLLFISIAGFATAFKLNGLTSAINSLIYDVPILLASVMLLIRKNKSELDLPVWIYRVRFSHLLLLTIFLFVMSLILLTSSLMRPLSYFVVVALISGLVFAQIISKRPGWTDCLILFEIVCLSLNVLWGVTLKYPLFFGYTDTFIHLNYVQSIIQTGHTNSLDITYQYFPLFHIFNAIASEVTALLPKDSLFIFMGISWQIGILFAFLIFRKFTHSSKLSLVGALLSAMSTEFLFYGEYTITRSLAFVLLLGWLYLILNTTETSKDTPGLNLKFTFLSLIAMAALILTHHVTVLFAIPLLLIIYVCQRIFSAHSTARIPLLPILLLALSFSAYLVGPAYSFTSYEVPHWLASVGASQTVSSETVSVSGSQTTLLISLLYYSFVLFLGLIGTGAVFRASGLKNRYLPISGIALASLFFLVLYISGPINLIPEAQSLLAYRFPLLVSPFIVITMAFGIIYFVSFENNLWNSVLRLVPAPMLTFGIIIFATFFSTISGPNGSDFPILPYPTPSGSEYFSNAELQSFSFLNQSANPSLTLYGDYETTRNDYSFVNLRIRQILIGGNTGSLENGYVVLRTGELYRRGSLSFSVDYGGQKVYRYHVNPEDPGTNIVANLSTETIIYSDGDVVIYSVIKTPISSQ